jgi:protein arginine N-methyltransferase 1
MYTIAAYGNMIADSIRTSAYVEALRQAVKPGAVVLDIGTGTGIFALLACQFGARRVYAIEPSDAIQVGREVSVANGYGDQIEFIQGLSTQITLPEKVDAIISDLHGALPLFQHHIPSIVDARQRFLAPGGVQIPQRDTLWATVVEAPKLYASYDEPWSSYPYGFKMEAARLRTVNTWSHGKKLTSEQFLVEPRSWAVLDYLTIQSPDIRASLTWTVNRAGTGHGLALWFDGTLAAGIEFSNAPDKPELVYGYGFFPWESPVSLTPGDTVAVTLQANLVGDDYIWRWETQVFEKDNPSQGKANFRQSTFYGEPLSLEQLRKRAETYIPSLQEAGQIDALILRQMGEAQSLGAIAREIAAQFPQRFPTYQAALTHVGDLSARYS